MNRMRYSFTPVGGSAAWRGAGLILGLLVGIVLGSRPAEAQYTADYQTNVIGVTIGVTSNWTVGYYVGDTNFADVLVITNNSVLSSVGGRLGSGAASSNNSVLVSGSGSVWTNTGQVHVGRSGSGNSLVISNGGAVVASVASTVGFAATSSNNSVLVTGIGSVWTNGGDLSVGNLGFGNSLAISSSGTVFNSGSGYIGNNSGADSNSVLVTGTGSVWNNGSDLNVGYSGSGNSLVITNGGTVVNSIGSIGGNLLAVASSSNSVLVTGTGSVWTNTGDLNVGYLGSGNSLVISNGGAVVASLASTVGFAATSSNNSVLVTGIGSVWTNGSDLSVGNFGFGNSLAISSSGTVFNSGSGYIGINSGADSNSVLVTGTGSVWTNTGDLNVGYMGSGNSLVITNGGTVVSSNLFVGYNSSSSNNLVTLNGGNLTVANALTNGVLDVRRGTFTINGGTNTVDRFVATNGVSSIVTFNGGALITKSTTVSNGAAFTVGNATSAATLNLQGGTHTFFNGLTISSNATLSGVGFVLGATTVNPGGTLAPGNGVGTLTISNSLVVSNGAAVQYELGTNSDLTAVSSNLTLAGTLDVTDAGGFTATNYTLFTYGGTLTTNGVSIGTAPSGYNYTINTNTVNQVRLVVGYQPVVAGFSASTTNGVAPLAVTFTNTSTGIITNGFWNFGDSTTNTTAISLNYTYTTGGTYTVSLTVSGPGGTSNSTLSNYIVVTNPPPPLASFTGIPTSGTASLLVTFTDSSTGNITNRHWNFGDGAISDTTATNTSHTYAAGTYNVSLTVSGLGGTNTLTQLSYITALTPGSITVTPAGHDFSTLATGTTTQTTFTVTNSGGVAVTNGTASTSAPFSILSGSSFSVSASGSTNVVVQFAPTSVGSFTQNVIFATANGGNSTNRVSGTGAIVPVASFTASSTNGQAPLLVTFTDSSTGTITNRHWSFGDGATSNALATSVAHTYNSAGSNTVQLIVSGPVGVSTNTRVNYVVVTTPCSYTLSATNASFGVAGGSNTVTVTASTNLCPWTATSNNSWIQIAGGSVSATGSAVVAYTVLPNASSSSPRTGTMTIAGQAFTVTQAGDTTAPTVVLTAPTSGITVSNTIAVSATATDNVAVTKVEFYVDSSVLLGTVTTPPYSVNFDTATVGYGSHCFYAKAYDAATNVSSSSTNCVTVNNNVPLASLLGTYNGLVIRTNAPPSHESSGSIKLVLSKTGSFAANLTMGGVKSAFKGQFDVSGNATNPVTRRGLDSLQVILHLAVAGRTEQITGTVSNDVFASELLADRAVFSRANPCTNSWVGNYTFVLEPPSDPGIPQGYGYGTLKVTTIGGGKLSGVLGDGTKISGNVPVSKYGTWPLYNALYKKQGSCIGWVTFATNSTLEATVDWFRPPMPTSHYYPAGFTTNVTLTGEKYVSPSASGPSPAGDRQIALGGGNLVSSIVKTGSVDAAGNVTVSPPNSENLKMKLQPATGKFSGSFTHPLLNKKITFKGLALQIDSAGAGYFLGTNESGYVTIEPVP